MMKRLPPVLLAIALVAGGCRSTSGVRPAEAAAEPDLTDQPEVRGSERPRLTGAEVPTYDAALAQWRSVEDVNAWIGARFTYDVDRAAQLSESERAKGGGPALAEPAAFFAQPRGVCLDLARFGYETLKRIDPAADPRYVMIELEPIVVRGVVLRRHWVVSFVRDGDLFVFADSKRPGHIAGPYASLDAFRSDYELFRKRRIVALQQTDTMTRRRARAEAKASGS